jgi:periplasmic protein TonB
MTEAARMLRPPELDDPIRRLIWIVPAAIAIWTILLSGFSIVLRQTKAPPMELKPLEARLIEIPPEVRGLQGGREPHPAPAAAPKPKTRPEPIVKPHPASHPNSHPIKKTTAPPVIRSPYGTEKTTEAPDVESAPGPSSGSSTSSSGTASEEGSGGAGIGSDTLGARAIYAPTPTIPDDLREDVMQAEAIAHFTVSFDGASEVTLAKPTSNPRLNQVLLDALKQWKFFPAMKNGVALASSFDVRIPISVK